MRIVYLVSSQGIRLDMTGGAGTHIRGTIRGFEENGHQVLPLIYGDIHKTNNKQTFDKQRSTNSKKSWKDFLPKFIRVLLRDINTYIQSIKFSENLLQQVIKFDPDIIYERSCMLSETGSIISKKLNVPLFLETSGCLVEIYNDSYGVTSARLANWLEKRKLKKADIVVTEAKSAIRFVKTKFSLNEKKIIAKPLGIELPLISSGKNVLKNNKILSIGYIGTFASYHNVELLLPVFEYFKNMNIRFYLIGSGGNYEQIKNWISNNKIENVIFTGYITKQELLNYLNIIDIGLVPNCESHMSPIKTFEYGVYEICPMVPKYEAFSDLIMPEENGIVFTPNSAESIIKNLKKVLAGQINYNKCAKNWNAYVIENYQWHQVVQDVLLTAEKK